MKILIISRCPPYPKFWGDRLILWHLGRELKQRGYTLDILAFTQFDSDHEETNFYADNFRDIGLIRETPRTLLNYLKRLLVPGTRFPKQARDAWSPEMWQAIEARLREEAYDVVHVFGGVHVYEFYHAVAQETHFIEPYESYSLYLRRVLAQENTLKNRLMQFLAGQFERFMFTPYPRAVVIAEPDKQELLRLNPKLSVEVISTGIDLTQFDASQNQPAPATLLFVGNYGYAPNQDAALYLATEIFPAVREIIPQAKLILAGKEPPPDIAALADEQIIVTGWVDDIRDVYARATIFVCPLRLGAGLKFKMLEALSMRLPIVASPVAADGIAIEPGKHALVCEVEAMATQLVALLQDDVRRDALATAGRQLIEDRYSWSGVAEQYIALYRSLQDTE